MAAGGEAGGTSVGDARSDSAAMIAGHGGGTGGGVWRVVREESRRRSAGGAMASRRTDGKCSGASGTVRCGATRPSDSGGRGAGAGPTRLRVQRRTRRAVDGPVHRAMDATAPVFVASRSWRAVAVGVGGRGGGGVRSPNDTVRLPHRPAVPSSLESRDAPPLSTHPTGSKANGRPLRPMGLRRRYGTYTMSQPDDVQQALSGERVGSYRRGSRG